MEKKTLSFPNKLPIHYDPNVDVLLGMLQEYPELYEKEVSEHFIDTIIYDNEFSHNVAFYRIVDNVEQDCLLLFDLPYEIAKASIQDMVEYVIQLLDQGYYVTFLWDTFWIRNYVSFQKYHAEHPALVYGYDRQKQIFLIQDYFDFKTLCRQEVTFSDVQLSYDKGEIPFYTGQHALINACVLYCKKIVNWQVGPPNLPLIKQKLTNFLESYPYANPRGVYYGLRFLDILRERCQVNPQNVPLKHWHFIIVHIQLMIYRIEVLKKYQLDKKTTYEEIADQLRLLWADVQKTEMRILKSNVGASSLKMDLGRKLADIRDRYSEIIAAIIRQL